MKTDKISIENHENAIYDAISSYITTQVPKYLEFTELLQYSGSDNFEEFFVEGSGFLNPADIGATTPELVLTDVVSWNHFFPGESDMDFSNYCVIFLKNSNFFVVLVKKQTDKTIYAVRDCHQNYQYDFDNFDELVKHLNQTYRFNQNTIVDGVPIPEFDNIEFLVIKNPFLINI